MPRTLSSLVAAVALCLVAGCGASQTDLNVCNANCDNEKKCGRGTDVSLMNCHTGCNNLAGLHAQADQTLGMNCTNVGQIRQEQLDCLNNSDACSQTALAFCQASASTNNCIKR